MQLPLQELRDSRRFLSPEHVVEQRLSHSTTPELARTILRNRKAIGSRPEDRRYDGVLARPDAPPCVYFHASPATERKILPFSWYPSRVPGGSPLSLITIRTEALASDDFLMYYVNTVPSQFGPSYWAVYRSQVLFVHRSHEDTLKFCERHLVPLDKYNNEVFYIDGEHGKLCVHVRVFVFLSRISNRGRAQQCRSLY